MKMLEEKARQVSGGYLELLDSDERARLEKKQIALFLFIKDSLVYWTDNKVSTSISTIDSRGDPALEYVGNGWYLTKVITRDSLTIQGFQLIRREYKYENKYLKPRFFRGAGLGDRYRLSTVPVENGFPVVTAEDEFLFSLVPVGANDPLLLRLLSALFYLSAFLFFFLWMVNYVRLRRQGRGWMLLLAAIVFGAIYLMMIK